ncbi:carboxypeptidase-like regulatory domain-containing protein [Lutibacter citreus]|uniref:carboxypeptidase-like regulatory domain-containing protein n=1 Tax=Lutibacter citreus TaxID=2138210 RepID=UPI000DBE2412|nr:carboxypeptidase-like regulatory domain-containing protein [Lutibacter citreus]
MKKLIILGFLCVFYCQNSRAQKTSSIRGEIYAVTLNTPLEGVEVKVVELLTSSETNKNGEFKINNLPTGNYLVSLFLEGYESQKIPVHLKDEEDLDLGVIYLTPVRNELQEANLIAISDEDFLDNENQNSDYIAGLFQSSKDAYLRAAAFNFSQAWFKVRGYDSSYGTISINGVEMNKLYDGRPQWSNWGGLNDALRNQQFSNGIQASETAFGGVLGTTNFITRASEYQKVSKVSVSSTNRSYTSRLMATYASGVLENNWSYVVSGSRRAAQNGYFEGTTYNSWAAYISAEKILNDNHSLSLTAFTSFNRRGKSSPNTEEVLDLRGYKYNSYWGKQEGNKRNSRMKEIFEPVVMLSHYFDSDSFSLQNSLTYQFGHISNSRLGYFNTPNPDPTYWKYLPSSFLRFEDNLDFSNAYLTEQEFLKNGQINWQNLYDINNENGNSLYYLYEDRVDDSQITFNTLLNASISSSLNLNAGLTYKNLTSNNYGNMLDLLGGSGFVDLDQYAIGEAQQNNLNNPNNIVSVDDEFQYNYKVFANVASAFGQLQFTKNKVDYFVGVNLKSTTYQRNGLFKNGTYSENSFGKGEKQVFFDVGVKTGLTYKFSGRHLINTNLAYVSNAPNIRNTFSNSRVNNNVTLNLTSEKILTGDVSYLFRSPKVQSRVTAFYTNFSDAIENSFFFAEGLLGDQADFVNEIITGVEKRNIGIELSAEYQLTPSVKLIAVGSVGQYTYNNNPQLYLQSESFTDENSDFGISYLKNYRISGTPQRAYSLGFEYRDPNYWWFQTNVNLLANNYLDISPLLRTDNFYLDADGVPFVDNETGVEVNQLQVDALLNQEKFEDAFLVNLVGGKSWKIKDAYLGVFVGVNNLLGEVFKTGGFEQSRNANYPELKEDKQLDKPIFGPKYWYGNDTSYYLNLYVRF